MSGVDELIAFVRAALDDDERDAKARRGIWPRPAIEDDGAMWLHVQYGGNAVVAKYQHAEQGYGDMAALRAWAQPEGEGWHAERVLAEVEAKRRILDEHQTYMGYGYHCGTCRDPYDDLCAGQPWPCTTIRLLAQPFAGREGWRAEWSV